MEFRLAGFDLLRALRFHWLLLRRQRLNRVVAICFTVEVQLVGRFIGLRIEVLVLWHFSRYLLDQLGLLRLAELLNFSNVRIRRNFCFLRILALQLLLLSWLHFRSLHLCVIVLQLKLLLEPF